ncbi:hypothetical protein M422DRAFT_28961 [Sphaerobolus stellatus SS14]|uniref:Uncharacterized protein n=1 Tax=Sphaerobolus stellatus (strain SS14) TaxID=990650 RepID=A0A0C9UKA1_SPHS4|nr:hypothetical protein M422DRAFT_38530 [Sphaerobolus stellatus SS14]KIJ47345.1 hypothetical protein M422DRAFT_28961 [Sphaerobolus stellatus SS14]
MLIIFSSRYIPDTVGDHTVFHYHNQHVVPCTSVSGMHIESLLVVDDISVDPYLLMAPMQFVLLKHP